MAGKIVGLMLPVLSMFFICGVAIYAGKSLEVTNYFETEIVDISLHEYEKTSEGERTWANLSTVLPDDCISKIPRISNEGCDCYVRAKVEFDGIEEIGERQLLGAQTDWEKGDDGYYYYTKVLPQGGTVDIFQGVHIPEDLSDKYQGKQFQLHVTVDAVQSKNFTPQFHDALPWGSVEIIASKGDGNYQINRVKPSQRQSFQIRYEADVQSLLTNSENFFSNFPGLMPGDCYSEKISLFNHGQEPRKIYFRSIANEDCRLSSKIVLKIFMNSHNGSKLLYEGPLNGSDLKEELLLGTFFENEEAELEFMIEVPAELNNRYTLYSSQVTWIFSTEPISYRNPGTIHTGDTAQIALYLIPAVMAVTIQGWIVRKKRKERVEKYEKE